LQALRKKTPGPLAQTPGPLVPAQNQAPPE